MESKLHSIFRYRNFRDIPPNCDPDLFLVKNDNKQTCLHVAATCDGFDHIPPELFTAENLCQRDSSGDTPIHLAAFVGKLQALPLDKLPTDTFYAQDGDGKSVIDIAREKGILSQVPISILLADEGYQYESILSDLSANRITEIDHRLMDPSIWSRTSSGQRDHQSLVHISAELGLFDQLPTEVLLPEVLRLRNHLGETPLHVLAKSNQSGSLGRAYARLPQSFDWMDKDASGNTILHCAARSGQLASVPVSMLTEEAVTIRNHDGASVLDVAFETKCLEVVPEKLRYLCDDYSRARLNEVLTSGDCKDIPKSLLLFSSLLRLLPTTKDISSILLLAAREGTLHILPPEVFTDEYIKVLDDMGLTPLHIAAANGRLENLPDKLLTYEQLSVQDKNGRTPCHVAISSGHLGKLPPSRLIAALLLIPDQEGVTSFHLGAATQGLGGIPVSLFSREVLLAKDKAGQSVADVIEKNGNTSLLPPHLQNLSKARALVRMKECFSQDFVSVGGLYARELAELITPEEFYHHRRNFVMDWSKNYPDLELDEEQADAVAEYGPHVQVTARAGSGKTRTLVARALFHIQHCEIPASSILILAFNKKAVEEIRERLGKFLSEDQMPHVLTFHALAYRIVKPAEDLIFDEGETKEGQVFSTTIQRIIDEGMRSGVWEKKLRELMQARWKGDLLRIIFMGFNLPQEDFLPFRARMPRYTMDGRRVDTEAHKNVGNALLRMGLRYSYQRVVHRAAGRRYTPDFTHYYKEKDQQFLIEILGQNPMPFDVARQAFWNSDRSTHSHLLQLAAEDCEDPDATLERLAAELSKLGVAASPMSDDELWLVLRDDTIRRFTKAAKGFISRCQKEMISPEWIEKRLPLIDPPLWILIEVSRNRFVRYPSVEGMQIRFWRLSSLIYRRYLEVLAESKQTDFDLLMLDAAGQIHGGKTNFSSLSGRGNIRDIKHILIDEYQDFSRLFNELRKSIITQSPDAKFFCVGDDWQAINKFAGSDLRYFTDFTKTFDPATRKLISRNYRSCRKIVEIGNRVMQDVGEPSVPNSNEQGNTWRVEVGEYDNLSDAEEIAVEELGDNALAILRIASDCTSRRESVTVLSRTSSIATPEGMDKLETWQKKLRSFLPDKDRHLLEVSTTHGYKGKEADVVILLDPEVYPFIHPDAIFSAIFGDTFHSIEEDEKRLFYVGVTRPKKTLYLLSNPSRYSVYQPYRIQFLRDAYPPAFDINRLQSNLLCGSRIVFRLTNLSGLYRTRGTFSIKDQLKKSRLKWNEDRKIWSLFLERGSINSPYECIQYLSAQPWIRDADGIIASFAWEDQKHQFRIDRGNIVPDNSIQTDLNALQPIKISNTSLPPQSIRSRENRPPAIITKAITDISAKTVAAETKQPPQNQSTQSVDRVPKEDQVFPPSPTPSDGIFNTQVVGMNYEGRMRKAEHLKAGEIIRLQREPTNPHDRNAIQVVTSDGVQIGYLSKHVTSHLAPYLDAWGGLSQARVVSVWKQPEPHFHVTVQICFPIPPGAVIPRELDQKSQWDDDPFGAPRKNRKDTPLIDPYSEDSGPSEPEISDSIVEPAQSPLNPSDPESEKITVSYEGLSEPQRLQLDNLLEPRLAPIIAELYLSGCSDWPQIGYEGCDANNICTGSMLEVAWLDFQVGIAIPGNDIRSFEQAGWIILPASTATFSELQALFQKGAAQMPASHVNSTAEPYEPPISAGTQLSEEDFIDTIKRIRSGAFIDDDPDDDIPF